MKYVAYNLMVS